MSTWLGAGRITQLQLIERLPRADCARAQHGVDGDASPVQVVARLTRMVFAGGGEPSLRIPATRPCLLGLGMAEDEQGASQDHPRSLEGRGSGAFTKR